MNAHKAAAVFPMLADAELDALASDIAKNGQRDPIVLLDGEILDGRNRFAACERCGAEPAFRDATDAERADPIAFVVSKNLHRRHMDESARAMAAARLREIACHNNDSPTLTVRAAASALNISHNAVAQAAHVLATAAPELVAAVDAGTIAVSAAAELVDLPAEDQRQAASDPKRARVLAREKRDARKTAPKPEQANVFACPDCGEVFHGVKVWHCKPCGSHWDLNLDRKECADCHAPRGNAAAEIAKLPVEQQCEAIAAPKATRAPKADATVTTVTEPSRERLRVLLKEAHAVASEIEKADNTKRASAHVPPDLVLRDIRRRIGKAQKQLADLIKVEAERARRVADERAP